MFKSALIAFVAVAGFSASASAVMLPRVDNRILVNKPADATMAKFQEDFTQICPGYGGGRGGVRFQSMYFHAGDYSGKNADSLVDCIFTNDQSGAPVDMTLPVLWYVGGSVATST